MALAAKQDARIEKQSGPAEVVPMPKAVQPNGNVNEAESGVTQTLGKYAGRATKVIETTKESGRKVIDLARTQASEGYSRVVRKAQHFGEQTRVRARQLKQEHPLQLIGIIAGAALVAGIAIRIWRSRTS